MKGAGDVNVRCIAQRISVQFLTIFNRDTPWAHYLSNRYCFIVIAL